MFGVVKNVAKPIKVQLAQRDAKSTLEMVNWAYSLNVVGLNSKRSLEYVNCMTLKPYLEFFLDAYHVDVLITNFS
jgi:hypothetical protein